MSILGMLGVSGTDVTVIIWQVSVQSDVRIVSRNL